MLSLPVLEHLERLQRADDVHGVDRRLLTDLCQHRSHRSLHGRRSEVTPGLFTHSPAFVTKLLCVCVFKNVWETSVSLLFSQDVPLGWNRLWRMAPRARTKAKVIRSDKKAAWIKADDTPGVGGGSRSRQRKACGWTVRKTDHEILQLLETQHRKKNKPPQTTTPAGWKTLQQERSVE